MEKRLIKIPLNNVELEGELDLPGDTQALVIFAHGSGSSRHSPRNQYVARVLCEKGLGTLLFDLLTADEEQAEAHTRHLRFDISLLAQRLRSAALWSRDRTEGRLRMGFFGSSTGAAAALVAAADLGDTIGAVVSRGGRPDLAGDALERVRAATLLLVGGHDYPVIPLNEEALRRLECEKELRLIPNATHLFEEPGSLETVSKTAADWFLGHLHPVA